MQFVFYSSFMIVGMNELIGWILYHFMDKTRSCFVMEKKHLFRLVNVNRCNNAPFTVSLQFCPKSLHLCDLTQN